MFWHMGLGCRVRCLGVWGLRGENLGFGSLGFMGFCVQAFRVCFFLFMGSRCRVQC